VAKRTVRRKYGVFIAGILRRVRAERLDTTYRSRSAAQADIDERVALLPEARGLYVVKPLIGREK
jgi:hypothetical protein